MISQKVLLRSAQAYQVIQSAVSFKNHSFLKMQLEELRLFIFQFIVSWDFSIVSLRGDFEIYRGHAKAFEDFMVSLRLWQC